jgi:oxygen-independent coproporphyrinogen-3 oxidase
MKVNVKCNGHEYIKDVEKICRLFFEQPELAFSGERVNEGGFKPFDDADLHITLKLSGDHPIHATAELQNRQGQWFHAEHDRSAEHADDPKTWNKIAKKAMSYVLLKVLTDVTGIEQPWGILTGVRPTKLMHTMLQEGSTKEEVKRILRDDFLLSSEKVELLSEIVDRQLIVLPDFYELDREVSVYIGIPFCPTKCAYCTFPAYAIQGKKGTVEQFLEGLHYEIREIGQWLRENNIKITTLYFGGGTPTSITAEQMDRVFEVLQESFPYMDQIRELTVEAGRPDTIDPDKINVMKKWKVDRISINPQSFTQETLDIIGRHHTVTETLEKFHLAREMGLDNINMDLIIGLPGEGVEEFKHSLEATETLLPESLTVHTLSFKRASEMTQNRDKYEVSERDEIGEMMQMATEWTAAQGYVPYYLYRQKNILGNLENVGYSLPGRESLYNIVMMEEKQTIIGLGCGAVSKIMAPGSSSLERYPNPKEPTAYNQTYEAYSKEKVNKLNAAFGTDLVPGRGEEVIEKTTASHPFD